MMSSKNKLDSILGITDIKELFAGSDVDSVLEQVKETIATNEKELDSKSIKIKERVDVAKTNLSLLSTDDSYIASFKADTLDITKSLDELNGLIGHTKGILTNLYKYVSQTDLIDPDVIAATAKIIDSGSNSIKTYIELYRERMRCAENLKLELLRHQSKIELEELKAELKYRYAMKLQENTGGSAGAINTDFVEFKTEDVLREIKKDKERTADNGSV